MEIVVPNGVTKLRFYVGDPLGRIGTDIDVMPGETIRLVFSWSSGWREGDMLYQRNSDGRLTGRYSPQVTTPSHLKFQNICPHFVHSKPRSVMSLHRQWNRKHFKRRHVIPHL